MIEAASALAKPLSADQEKLLALEQARDEAAETLRRRPQYTRTKGDVFENPAYEQARVAYQKAKTAYEAQKAKMIEPAQAEARASMAKKYLDAVQGTIKVDLIAFNTVLPLNVETFRGEKYLEISDQVVDSLTSLIFSILKSTVSKSFWSSADMQKLGKGLQRWYTYFAPFTRGLINAIADGEGFGAVMVLLMKTHISQGVLQDDSSMFGLNFNIDTSYALDIFGYDKFSVGLCEQSYEHREKSNFYNLYGFVEYFGYVSPALVSKSGQEDAARLRRLQVGLRRTEDELSDMDIGEAVKELIAFIKFHLGQEVENLKNIIIQNIKGVDITADISLKPQEVLNELLKEKKAGSIRFDKGSLSIEGLHLEGVYLKRGSPEVAGSVGAGAGGSESIIIPGATYTYLSQDTGIKVSYNSLEITPLHFSYKDDVYKLLNRNIRLQGLRVGILK
jgi:hypothetical protein